MIVFLPLTANPAGQQRELLMTTIKTVQESIESIRKDMMSTASPAKIPAPGAVAGQLTPARKSREEAQREVLDAELDLITKQQEGGDTSELQRRLLELRAQAYTLTRGGGNSGGMRGGTRGVGGGGGRRGRGPARSLLSKNNLVLDNNSEYSELYIDVMREQWMICILCYRSEQYRSYTWRPWWWHSRWCSVPEAHSGRPPAHPTPGVRL